jgi:hypothetical protein
MASVNNGATIEFNYSGTAVLSAEDYAAGGRAKRWIRNVQSGGSVDIELVSETSAGVAVYHLVPDGGSIALLDSTETNFGVIPAGSFVNNYTFGANSSGVLLEAASTYGYILAPSNSTWQLANVKRSVAHSYFSNVSSLTSTWQVIGIGNTGSAGLAFANAKIAGEDTAGVNEAQLKEELEALVDAEVTEWASLWPVYEWDVINEANGNNIIQLFLGWDQMAEWFKIAESNAPVSGCGLFLNEYNILSSPPAADKTTYSATRDMMMRNLDLIQAYGGGLSGIGFQSRVHLGLEMDELYSRLSEFGDKYGLPMVGTEFEFGNTLTNEFTRAQKTEEVLTTYFSHPLTTGLNAWTYMKDELRSMCYRDGTIKLNGLIWYYVHRIRYNTNTNGLSDANGQFAVSAYKGDYDITVSYNGTDYPETCTLTSNDTVVITLNGVDLAEIGYSNWLTNYPSLGTRTNRSDNPDHDALNNFGEYVFGGNPTNRNDEGIALITQMTDTGMELIHVQRNDDPTLNYWLETSTNLVAGIGWTNDFYSVFGTNTNYGMEHFDAVTNNVPTGTEPQRFIRLRAGSR